MTIEIRGALALFTGSEARAGGDIRVTDGLIASIGGQSVHPASALELGGDDPVEIIDAGGCVVTPGLVNAHHHLLQTAFRTIPEAKHTRMKDWLAVMAGNYRAAAVDGELAEAAALVGVAEGLLCGVTTVADHHLTWPPGIDPVEIASAACGAARRLGGRIAFVRGSAGDDAEGVVSSIEALVVALAVEQGLSTDGIVQLAVGPAGVHSDGRETFDAVAAVARRHRLRRRTQANEQVDVEIAQARYGRRPLELLDEWGWLEPDVTVAHCCEIRPDEIDRLARTGVSATHAPGCDLPSGWGVMPVGALTEAGVAIGMGTSGGGSNDGGHLLSDARLAVQVAPLSSVPGPPLTALGVLSMCTRGSANGLGRTELGRLEAGAAADLCCWDVDDVFDSGVRDPVAGLVWAAPGRRPRHVIVAGEVVVRDGELVSADSRQLAARLDTLLLKRLGSPVA